ncbi:MAG: hypothetical protein ACREQQ_06755 [Candidatus Binatia bacterium]
MKRTSMAVAALVATFAAGTALAHEEETENPTFVFENWRDNFFPFIDDGDPRTRHDSDATNDEGRHNPETRRSDQRWRDEVRSDGSVGEVGDGCMETFCTFVADDDGDAVRVDHTVTAGPSTRQGDRNAVSVEVLGAGGTANLGPAQKQGPLAVPDLSQAAFEEDGEPDDPSGRGAPTSLHAGTAGDHSLLGAAHSNTDHSSYPEQGNHDSHGGSTWVDLYADPEEPSKTRDSRAGVVIMDHLGCEFGCSDEYHTAYAADPERTIFQAGEAPDQAEFVAEDPDRWLFGMGNDGESRSDRLDPVVSGPATQLHDDVVNPNVDPVTNAATGVGDAAAACCAPRASDGRFCNRNVGGALNNAVDNGVIAGCVDLSNGDCVGGVLTPDGLQGCMVSGGEATVGGAPATEAECTEAAAAACCDNEACL